MTSKEMNIAEISLEMARIRRFKERVITNYYNQCQNYSLPMWCVVAEKSCVFVWPDNGIDRVYFYSSDKNELIQLLATVKAGACLDYITKNKEEDAELFQAAGFEKRLEYGRFNRNPLTEDQVKMHKLVNESRLYDSEYGEPAQVEDAEELDRCLREKFDPYEAHFYSIERLRDYIQRGWVWIARENGKIIAAKLFEIQGKKCYGSFSFNNGPLEALTSMCAKASAAIQKMGAKYHYCWMNLGNKRAIRYSTKFDGYVFDGTYDIIYVKQSDESEEVGK